MIDPVTAIGLATTAYNGIKQAISVGREISDMGSQLGQWARRFQIWIMHTNA